MAQRFTTTYVNTVRPGAYVKSSVRSTPSGVGQTGDILIIGEAEGGQDFTLETALASNFFGPDQADVVARKYIKGPIVDAMNMLSNPSNDVNISGAPGRVFIIKTNNSTKASAAIPSYGTASDLNFGKDGNKYSFRVITTQAEIAPTVTSDDLATAMLTPAVFNGLTFGVRLNGSALTTIALSNTTTDHDTMAELASEIDAQLPAGMSCIEDGNTLVISVDADSAANTRGHGKNFELVELNAGDLAVIGLDAGIIISAAEPEIEMNVVRPDIDANETLSVAAEVAMEIGYQGTTALLNINSTTLSTTVTGGSGTNLSINLADFATLTAMADFIQAQPGYVCSIVAGFGQKSPKILDQVSALGICTTATGVKAGRVKSAVQAFKDQAAIGQYLSVAVTATAGLPPSMTSYVFLAGGSKGGTTGAKFLDALGAAEGLTVNFIVPLFSRDAALDIADGLTEGSSTYTIDAIHASVKNHAIKMSQVKAKKNRQGFLSIDGLFADAKQKAASLANFRQNVCFQKVQQINSNGVSQIFGSWMASVCAAGMQSAGFNEALVNKFANVISYVDPSDFDSNKNADIEKAIESGLLLLERTSDGVRWVSDQTTYGFDSNFVFNSIQAVYAKDIIEIDLGASLHKAFVGKSLADVEIGTVLSFISTKMDSYKRLKLIASSDDAPAGFRNVNIEIDGPAMYVKLEIKLATALYFIGVEMEISQVSRSTEG
jgi:hypothetical protein